MLHDAFYYIVGIAFLALAKAKHVIRGYSTPRPFGASEIERCIEYDFHVVEQWLSHLRKYTDEDALLEGKNVLELGPGSDFGAGLLLLAKGATTYCACDVTDLAASAPDEFYERFLERLRMTGARSSADFLRGQLNLARAGKPSKINYVVRRDFDLISAFGEASIDLVLSYAAFEHFDDIDATVAQLGGVCKPGAVIVAEIDLKTHSRWVRKRDPNNIYRYGERVYGAFGFRGIPNRIRPYQYKEAFERLGWTDVAIIPLSRLEGRKARVSGLNRRFRTPESQMDLSSVVICARKKGPCGDPKFPHGT